MDACAPLNTTGTGPVIDEPIGTERELRGGGTRLLSGSNHNAALEIAKLRGELPKGKLVKSFNQSDELLI